MEPAVSDAEKDKTRGTLPTDLSVRGQKGDRAFRSRSMDRQDVLLLNDTLVTHLIKAEGGLSSNLQGSAKRCFLGCVNSLPGSAWL